VTSPGTNQACFFKAASTWREHGGLTPTQAWWGSVGSAQVCGLVKGKESTSWKGEGNLRLRREPNGNHDHGILGHDTASPALTSLF